MGKGSRLRRERGNGLVSQALELLEVARQPDPNFAGPYFQSSVPVIRAYSLGTEQFRALARESDATDVPDRLLQQRALCLEVDLDEHPGAANMMADDDAGLPVLQFTNSAHSGGNVVLTLGIFRAVDEAHAETVELYQNPAKVEVALDPVTDRPIIEALLHHNVLFVRSVDHTGVTSLNGDPSIVRPGLVFEYDPETPAGFLLALTPDLR